jgi:hypothetical protein
LSRLTRRQIAARTPLVFILRHRDYIGMIAPIPILPSYAWEWAVCQMVDRGSFVIGRIVNPRHGWFDSWLDAWVHTRNGST